jgi:predicted RNA methylase
MNLKALFTGFYYESKDSVRRALGELVPPRKYKIQMRGDDSFNAVGKEFFDLFVGLGNLKPHESVLDVGCRVGRMAIPLTRYLSTQGEYCGFDIDREAVKWYRDNILHASRISVSNYLISTTRCTTRQVCAGTLRIYFDTATRNLTSFF